MAERRWGAAPALGLVGAVVALFVATLGFLVWQSRPPAPDERFVSPETADLVLKTVATGAIVPRAEVEIKSRVSGVLAELAVQPGQLVEQGDLVARVQVVPNAGALASAQDDVRAAKIQLDDADLELQRAESLAASAALAGAELQAARTARNLARQRWQAASSQLQIVREGATRGSGDVSTEIRSTVRGMILDVPVEEGQSITETNTFSDGTTIASVANMDDLVFEGKVDESEVGRIREGMPLDITVSALRTGKGDRPIGGALEYISPKGVVLDGSVQFEIRAAIRPEEGLFIRAGSSANADIVLDRRDDVLAVDEAALSFEGGKPFVEVEVAPGRYEKRELRVGLSDGLKIEVLEGLSGGERLRIPAGPSS